MKLKVTQENLAKALNYVSRVASSRGTLPVLANVLLSVEENRLRLAATNLDIAISCYVGAQVQKPGSLTVPARLLQDLITSLPSGVIELEQDEMRLKVQTNHYKSVINGVSAEEFPVMPTIENGTEWHIETAALKEGLQQVILAASNDESRPVLTGVLFHTIDGFLYAASTDSYRLAERRLMKTDQSIRLLIPATALHDTLRIIADYTGDTEVVCDDQQVLFKAGDVELVARLIDGNYPDYRKLIPQSFETSATLMKADFVNITKVASLFARESAGSVVLSADTASESVWIRAVASQVGENDASAAATVSGGGEVTLNSRYLLDALQVIDGKDVQIRFNGKVEPVLLSNPEKEDYLHLIMPLKS